VRICHDPTFVARFEWVLSARVGHSDLALSFPDSGRSPPARGQTGSASPARVGRYRKCLRISSSTFFALSLADRSWSM
jgi:hypothetical protein